MTLQTSATMASFDPYDGELYNQIFTGYMEQMFMSQWTADPSVQSYQLNFWSDDATGGNPVKTWEFTAPSALFSIWSITPTGRTSRHPSGASLPLPM